MPQNRWKSPVVWTSLAGLLFFVLKSFGLLEWIGLGRDDYDELVSLIITLLTTFGVLNNPTDGDKF